VPTSSTSSRDCDGAGYLSSSAVLWLLVLLRDSSSVNGTICRFSAVHLHTSQQYWDYNQHIRITTGKNKLITDNIIICSVLAKPFDTTHKRGSRHCHLLTGYSTILVHQRVFDCKYLSCKIRLNESNYVFILFIFNLYCLVNIQQLCHNSSHCD